MLKSSSARPRPAADATHQNRRTRGRPRRTPDAPPRRFQLDMTLEEFATVAALRNALLVTSYAEAARYALHECARQRNLQPEIARILIALQQRQTKAYSS